MANIGDLTVGITCDPSQLTEGMTQVREQIEQTTTVIQLQDTTWRAFSETVVGSLAKIAVPALRLVNTYKQIQLATIALTAAQMGMIPPTLTLASAMGFLLSPITLVVGAIALAGAAIYYFSSSSDEAAESTRKAGHAADEAAPKLSRLQTLIRGVSTAVLGDDNARIVAGITGEYENLQAKVTKLGDTITKPFEDAATSLKALAFSLIDIDSAASAVSGIMRQLGTEVDNLTKRAETAVPAFAAGILSLATGMSELDAGELIAIGGAINDQNAAIAKMREQGVIFGELRAMQDDAAIAAERQAEVGRVSSLVTIEAINAEILALQERAAQTILAGKADEEWKKQTDALFQALEKQRQGIINGTVIDKAAEDAKRALKKAEEDAAKAAADAKERQERQFKTGDEKINALRDQIDLLSGAATKAEIAMREMARQGFVQEQVDEIGRLTEELEKLQKEDKAKKDEKKPGGEPDRTSLKASFAGTQEAASILLRGVGGKSMEQIAQKQLTVQQQTLVAVKGLTVAPVLPISFGV